MMELSAKKKIKYDRILAEAQTSFLNVGFAATKMDQIAKDAGVTKQTIYRYFPSKLELFEAILNDISENHAFDMRLTIDLDKLQESLAEFALKFVQFHLSDIHLNNYRLILTEARTHPEIFEIFVKIGPNPMIEMLISEMARHFKDEDLRAKIDMWLAMLLSLRNRQLIKPKLLKPSQIEAHVTLANQMFLSSLD